jgi:putative ABC transport system permease protein
MRGDVTPLGLAASLVLVAVAVAISWWRRLGLERRILWATVRAIVQLLAVGVALALVIDPAHPLVYAGDVVRRRAPEIPQLLPLAAVAFVAATALTLGVVFGFGIVPAEGRTVVPLAGMMVGNAMNAAVLTARRTVEELRDKRGEIEARLALGQPASVAARPYLAAALRTALIPQIETTKAVGLVFLPGAMTGLILAGVEPVDAVLVQAVVMFLVLGAVATTSAVIGLGLVRRLFTADHRLLPLPRPADA